MNIIDYIRATKAQKSIGTEFAEDIANWQDRHSKMVEEMLNGPSKPLSLKIDEMWAENLIFYNISGSKSIDQNTLFSIDATTIDNTLGYTQHIYPTYILIKDPNKEKEPASVNNTQMFRICYQNDNNRNIIKYDIDTMIENKDPTTSKIFPVLFCSLFVCTSTLFNESREILTYKPLKDYRFGNRLIHKKMFSPITEIYENRIIPKLRQFEDHPSSTFEPDKEM
jgi:hypothetical protein